MRITKRTNLAMRVLMFCAVNDGRSVTKAQIAQGCNSSQNHLGHVINRLGQLGYLQTLRGRHGGVRLARAAAEISVGEVFRAMESDVPVVECMAVADNTCPLIRACRLRGAIAGGIIARAAGVGSAALGGTCIRSDTRCAASGSTPLDALDVRCKLSAATHISVGGGRLPVN